MNPSHFLVLILFFGCLSAKCQTTLDGSAKQWAGKTIRLIKMADPITEYAIELDSDTIAPDGSFTLKANVSKTQSVWMYVKRYRAPLFIEPDADYHIVVVAKPENILVDTWLKGSFAYGITKVDSTDVNTILGDFDRAYYNFYLDNARLLNSPVLKKKIPEFEEQHTLSNTDSYIKTYRQGSIAEMKLSAGVSPRQLYTTYLFNKPVYPDNPGWYSYFDLFYADYFQNFDSRFGGALLSNRIRMGMQPDSLYRLLDIDPFLANDTLKQWVLMKSINQVYNSEIYPTPYLNRVLEIIQTKPATPRIAKVASRLKLKIKNRILGMPLDSVATYLQSDPTFSPKGKNTVLMVSTHENIESAKEKVIMRTLIEKYGEIFQFIEVQIDSKMDETDLGNKVFKPKDDFAFLEKFEIYSMPYFIWFGTDGKIQSKGIEKPSEGLEERLYKLQYKKDQSRQIKVGQW